jgi:CheY-like chemotaxis protein
VRITRKLKPDLALMDIRMPGMDGIEATRQLTGDGSGGPRILVLTTFDLDEYGLRRTPRRRQRLPAQRRHRRTALRGS